MFWKKPPIKKVLPQGYCTDCGSEMVDSYVVMGRRYSPVTGRKQERRAYTRVCRRIAGREHGGFRMWHSGQSRACNLDDDGLSVWEDA